MVEVAAHSGEARPHKDAAGGYQGVLVLGMHRSGTSALSGCFASAGFFAGADEELMPANEGNPAGYFERWPTMELNDRLLAEAGGTWDAPPPPSAVAAVCNESWAESVGRAVRSLVDDAAGKPVVVKDPRVCLLLPAWRAATDGLLLPLLCVREPLEVARSLKKRDGRDLRAGLALWEIYVTAVLDAYAGSSLTLISYEALTAAPETGTSMVEQVRARLSAPAQAAVDPSQAARALVPSLRRQHATAEEHATSLTRRQEELYDFLRSAGDDLAEVSVPDALRRPTDMALETAGLAAVQRRTTAHAEALDITLQGVRDELAKTAYEREQLRSEANALEQQLQGLTVERDHAQAHAHDVEQQRDTLSRARDSLIDASVAWERAAHERELRVRELAAELEAARAQARQLDEDLRALRTSTTWKVGKALVAPLAPARHLFRHGSGDQARETNRAR